MPQKKKISTKKWVVLFLLTGIIDVLQILIDLTGVGIPVSVAAEPFIGVGLVIICQLMGINIISNPKRLGSMLAAFGLGAVTGGIAPLWIIDIWYLYYSVKKEEVMVSSGLESGSALIKDGIRKPQSKSFGSKPLVVDGTRRPS